MNPYLAYRNQDQPSGWTRIDVLLALYDGALERMDKASAALAANDRPAALPLLAKAQLIVSELAAGVRLDVDEKMGINMLRLYEFVTYELSLATPEHIGNARKIMVTLREGFEAIRPQAIEMERTGQVVAADSLRMFHAMA